MIISIGDLFPLISTSSFAFSSAIIRKLEQYGSPIQLNLIRTTIGSIIFLLQILIIRNFNELLLINSIILLYLVLSVFFNIVVGDSSYFASQNILGIKIATPIVNTFPFFTILIAIIWLGEAVQNSLLLGGLFIILGISTLSADSDIKSDNRKKEKFNFSKKWVIGLSLSLIAVICYSFGIIFTTLATENLDPIVANSIRLPSASLMLFFLVSLYHLKVRNERSPDRGPHLILSKKPSFTVIFLLSMAGVFGTYISSIFLVLSVQTIGASRSAVLFATGPLFSLPFAIFWLKESVNRITIIGTILTIIGLWIVLN